nr:MAG TPA: hypothetical protein [Bacteriophage sp.]
MPRLVAVFSRYTRIVFYGLFLFVFRMATRKPIIS